MFRNRLAVLNYHQIPEQEDPLRLGSCSRKIFRNQLHKLGRYFNVLSMPDAMQRLRDQQLPRNAVVITFDDGYRDNYEVAFEELMSAGLPACFFIASDYINGGRMWNDTLVESIRLTQKSRLDASRFGLDELSLGSVQEKAAAIRAVIPAFKYMEPARRLLAVDEFAALSEAEIPGDLMMSSDQIATMDSQGMTIGGHTASHPILRNLSLTEARDDIVRGQQFLSKLLDKQIEFFAYPNGKPGNDYDRVHTEILKDLGFVAAFTTEWGYASHTNPVFELPRVGFTADTDWRFAARLQRSYFEAPKHFAT